MPEDVQLQCFSLIMHLLVRMPPPSEGPVGPFIPDEGQRIIHEGALRVVLTFLEVGCSFGGWRGAGLVWVAVGCIWKLRAWRRLRWSCCDDTGGASRI